MASLKTHHPDTPPLIPYWPVLYANKELVGHKGHCSLSLSGNGRWRVRCRSRWAWS
jgi:hypothetical protein